MSQYHTSFNLLNKYLPIKLYDKYLGYCKEIADLGGGMAELLIDGRITKEIIDIMVVYGDFDLSLKYTNNRFKSISSFPLNNNKLSLVMVLFTDTTKILKSRKLCCPQDIFDIIMSLV